MKSIDSTWGQNGKVLTVFDKKITELIGTKMGVSPDKVTTLFIHLWREEELYPNAAVEVGTNGYSVPGRTALTFREVNAQSDKAKAFFGKFVNGKNLD